MEVGQLSRFCPNSLFGLSDISKTSSPPLSISSCLMYILLYGFPFNVIAFTYMFLVELLRAMMVKVLPLGMLILALSNTGLPKTYSPPTGATGYNPIIDHTAHALI